MQHDLQSVFSDPPRHHRLTLKIQAMSTSNYKTSYSSSDINYNYFVSRQFVQQREYMCRACMAECTYMSVKVNSVQANMFVLIVCVLVCLFVSWLVLVDRLFIGDPMLLS